jgi:hypothetical protein
MTDPKTLAWLLAQPLPDPVEGLRKDAFLLGWLEALIESRIIGVRIDALLEGSQTTLDAAFDLLNEARDLCADLERAFELCVAKVEDEDLLAELEQERQCGHEDGRRRK